MRTWVLSRLVSMARAPEGWMSPGLSWLSLSSSEMPPSLVMAGVTSRLRSALTKRVVPAPLWVVS